MLLLACGHERVIVRETPRAACDLPPLPMPYRIVGFPDEQRITVVKDDLDGLEMWVAGAQKWMRAASGCLGGP